MTRAAWAVGVLPAGAVGVVTGSVSCAGASVGGTTSDDAADESEEFRNARKPNAPSASTPQSPKLAIQPDDSLAVISVSAFNPCAAVELCKVAILPSTSAS